MKKIEKRLGVIIIFFVILLLIFIGIFILRQYLSYKEAKFVYNGFEVQKLRDKNSEFYRIKIFINENNIPSYVNTIHNPKNLEKIPIIIDKDSLLEKKQIYITIDPYANLTGKTTVAALEIDKFLDNPFLFNIPVNSAFTKKYKDNENLTVKTCNDSSQDTGIILLQLAQETKIYEDNCTIVQGKTEDDLIRASNRLSLTILGVMNP